MQADEGHAAAACQCTAALSLYILIIFGLALSNRKRFAFVRFGWLFFPPAGLLSCEGSVESSSGMRHQVKPRPREL